MNGGKMPLWMRLKSEDFLMIKKILFWYRFKKINRKLKKNPQKFIY